MAKNKTTEMKKSVLDFIHAFADTEQKQKDSYALLDQMQEISGHEARMWGPSIIGFGTYHYKYASGHEGDAPLVGFSPRKAAISLYVFTGLKEHENLLEGLGKFKMGKACIYIKRLSDIDQKKLISLMRASIHYIQQTHPEKDQ
jgi:hypothetical protein